MASPKKQKDRKKLPPEALLKTWFTMMVRDIGESDSERKVLKEQAKKNILAVFGTTENAVTYFRDKGWFE